MTDLKLKVLEEVKKIKKGSFATYKEVATRIGRPEAFRLVANVLARNKNAEVPCHRVVRSDLSAGGYNGLLLKAQNPRLSSDELKIALLLKEGVPVVMPTDTIYGICTSAYEKEAVEKLYQLRKRRPSKPFIILIPSPAELKNFGISLDQEERKFLEEIWPSKISVILTIANKDKNRALSYLHRGTNSLAFRVPSGPSWFVEVLKISGPLVAPSANWEGCPSAQTIAEAKRYFADNVIYHNKGKIVGAPSTLIKLNSGQIEVLREGSDLKKLKNALKTFPNGHWQSGHRQ